MNSAHNLLVNQFIKKTLKVIEQDNGHYIKFDIQSGVDLQKYEDRKLFYKNCNKHDEQATLYLANWHETPNSAEFKRLCRAKFSAYVFSLI